LSTTPLDLLQAMLEAVALRLSLIADQLPGRPAAVMAGGGALHASPVWAQIVANALDHPLHILTESEPTARGVALLALKALGEPRTDTPPRIARVVEPQPEQAARLREARDRQVRLYRQLYGGQ
jgi:gluconokinase